MSRLHEAGGANESPIPGLSALREVTPPSSLVPTVMQRLAEPRPVESPVSFWAWLLRRPRQIEAPIPGLRGLREVTPPSSLVPAVMQRVAEQGSGAEAPIPGLRDLRTVTPPPSLVPAVMQRVAEPRSMSFWDWLRRPRKLELRLSPLGAAACAVVVVAIGAVGLSRVGAPTGHPGALTVTASLPAPSASASSEGAVASAAEPVVLVRFVLMAKGAKKVAVAGDFNGWNPETTALEDSEGRGIFVANVPLAKGAHEYMFVVDGEWVSDPAASERRPDGFGRNNAVLRL